MNDNIYDSMIDKQKPVVDNYVDVNETVNDPCFMIKRHPKSLIAK